MLVWLSERLFVLRRDAPMEIIMKTTASILLAAALTLGSALSSAPAHAVVLDLSTMTCKQFIEGGEDEIKMVLTWMDGWYKGDSTPKCSSPTPRNSAPTAPRIRPSASSMPPKKFSASKKLFVLTRFLARKSLRNLRKLDCYANRYPLENAMLTAASRTRSRPSPPACCRWRLIA